MEAVGPRGAKRDEDRTLCFAGRGYCCISVRILILVVIEPKKNRQKGGKREKEKKRDRQKAEE